MKLGILDYSLKNKDDFGITGLVERGYASTQDATIFVARDKQDYLFKKLASLRSTLAVYFDDSGYESQIVYGFTRDWDVGVQYPTYIQITISLERSEEHTSELQSLMRITYTGFCLKKKK